MHRLENNELYCSHSLDVDRRMRFDLRLLFRLGQIHLVVIQKKEWSVSIILFRLGLGAAAGTAPATTAAPRAAAGTTPSVCRNGRVEKHRYTLIEHFAQLILHTNNIGQKPLISTTSHFVII